MSQAELAAYTLELRTLQKSPQALGRKLRAEGRKDEDGEETGTGTVVAPVAGSKGGRKKVTASVPQGSLDDLMKELGG